MFIPNSHQLAGFDAFKNTTNHLLFSAVAGSGKSTTLLELLKFIPAGKRVIFLAFNKSIQLELQGKVSSSIEVKTLHGKGSEICFANFPLLKTAKKKIEPQKTILWLNHWLAKPENQYHIENLGTEKESTIFYYKMNISKIYDYMRLNLVSKQEEIEELVDRYNIDVMADEIEVAVKVYDYFKNTDNHFTIDFADMLWLPYIRHKTFPTYDYVFVDECQDLSTVQIEMVFKLAGPKGRMIFCGDKKQQLYAFASADVMAWEKICNIPNITILPLGYNYRCGKDIVGLAKTLVPEIEPGLTHDGVIVQNGNIENIQPGDFVLCRNNYPLILLYVYLIKKKVPVVIKGAEIGQDLIYLVEKVGKKNLKSSAKIVMGGMWKILKDKIEKLRQKGHPAPEKNSGIVALKEKMKIVKILIEFLNPISVEDLIKLIRSIFSEDITNKVVLSTIHKAKGLENDRVYFYLPKLIPSPFAQKTWEKEAERNLQYVAITRAKNELIFVHKDLDGNEVDVNGGVLTFDEHEMLAFEKEVEFVEKITNGSVSGGFV